MRAVSQDQLDDSIFGITQVPGLEPGPDPGVRAAPTASGARRVVAPGRVPPPGRTTADQALGGATGVSSPGRGSGPLGSSRPVTSAQPVHGAQPPGAAPGPQLGSGSQARAARRRRTLARSLILVLALVLVAGAGLAAIGALRPVLADLTRSNDYPGPGTGRVSVTVSKGDTGRTIGAILEHAGVVKTAKAFADAASAHSGEQIQPGAYTLRRQMSAAGALTMLLDATNRTVPKVTLREGLWKSEVFAALARSTHTPLGDYTSAARHPAQIDLPAAARGGVEGWLFPATYEFDSRTSAVDQLKTMVDKTRAELAALRVSPASAERTLTIASIVQAEARRPVDFARISRVIANRLRIKQKLQLDSTVSYAAQRRSVTTTDAERAGKSAYNTYQVAALPAGPIGNPGVMALQAALHPAAGPWLYFVAVNPVTGETRYATTRAGHAVNELLFHKWCGAHPGKC